MCMVTTVLVLQQFTFTMVTTQRRIKYGTFTGEKLNHFKEHGLPKSYYFSY